MGTINQAEIAAIRNVNDRETRFKEEWANAERTLIQKIEDKCREQDLSEGALAYITDLNATRLNKAKNGEGKVFIPYRTIGTIAHTIFSSSCHSLYFTDCGTTMLPRKLSYLAETLMNLNLDKRDYIRSAAWDIFNDASSKKAVRSEEPIENTNKKRSVEEARAMSILNERIEEMAADKGLKVNQLFYPQLAQRQTERLHTIRIGTISYQDLIARLAINHNTSIDYFIDYDYTQYTKCRLYESDVIIKARDIIDVISCDLRVQKPYKFKLETMILNERMNMLCDKPAKLS